MPFVREAPRVFVIVNEAKEKSEFSQIITMINLSADTLCDAKIHLPQKYRGFSEVLMLDVDGQWGAVDYDRTDDGITLREKIAYLDAIYLMFK